ncbi:MAG TPA: ABC transporter permease subunit [Oligoflexia bacterium]|nr:ABC transporter permease subunit [Oligoflexia bacterium]HMR24147.1 ABC transporter permease subunit [Oligoflexia bacterium]
MIERILAITTNTFREAVRQKVLYALVLFSGFIILLSLFLGQLTLGADVKIIKDMGLASMMFIGVMISVFIGVGLIFKEVQRKTIYTLLSKPVQRFEFILGKFFGLSATIALELLCMAVLLFTVLSFYKEPLDINLIKPIILIFCELSIIVAIALLFSSYSSSFMSIIFTLGVLFFGHATDDFVMIVRNQIYALATENGQTTLSPWINFSVNLLDVLESFSLDIFAINAKIVHGVMIPWSYIVHAVFYAICIIAIIQSLTIWVFNKKDLQ